MDKAKRKEILKKYKEEQEQKFLNSLPMPVEKFVQLFDYLDKANQGCKGDLQLTVRFLVCIFKIASLPCKSGLGI